MFFLTVIMKTLGVLQENIRGEDFVESFRKASLIEIYNKFIFLINTAENGSMIIFYFNWLAFDIFILYLSFENNWVFALSKI